jgi:hypothetical protein
MTYRSVLTPSNSSVATGVVTMAVCAWFLMATGAILTDNHSETLVEAARASVAEQLVVPDDRVTIVVEARRNAVTL